MRKQRLEQIKNKEVCKKKKNDRNYVKKEKALKNKNTTEKNKKKPFFLEGCSNTKGKAEKGK